MKSLEWRVGVFVFVALALIALLLLAFSKGTVLFKPSYDILLSATDASGLKLHADVLMSGVKVGSVENIALGPGGKSVIITLRIYKQFEIHSDARFLLDQSGFLGDEFISVTPTENRAPLFTNGQPATAEAPFNLQQAERSAAGLLQRVDDTFNKLNAAFVRIDSSVLNERTLTNLALSVANLRTITESATGSLVRIELLISSNTPAISRAVSNLEAFSSELQQSGAGLHRIISTNGPELQVAVKNLETSTQILKGVLQDVQDGKGALGGLIENQQLAADLQVTINNLSVTTSNLNRYGLWHMFWHHNKPPPAGKGGPPQ
jgi:phospholipid/cholesterol/gamma-HCH transport system substrate-binding protein